MPDLRQEVTPYGPGHHTGPHGAHIMGNRMFITGVEITALIAVAYQPYLAQLAGAPQMPWPVQAGAIAMLGGLLWWQMAKTSPEESKRRGQELDRMLDVHSNTSKDISDDIKEMTGEIKAMRLSTEGLMKTIQAGPCLLSTADIKTIQSG